MLQCGSLEAAVPLSHLVDLVNYLTVDHGYGLLHEAKVFIYGHVGTCDLHALWMAPPSWPQSKRIEGAKEAVSLESEVNLKWGCASGEIGQTAFRASFLRQRYGEAAYSMLMRVKQAFDPNNIFNPGNL
jgi:FAD/FMN-containing dehydrogenase